MTKEELIAKFIEQFGDTGEPIDCYFAPGRVNIIGEHQDYNGGHVFPAALTCGIWGAMRLRDDSKVRLYSENMEATIVVDINDDFVYDEAHDWANYPLGIIEYLKKMVTPYRGWIYSTVVIYRPVRGFHPLLVFSI